MIEACNASLNVWDRLDRSLSAASRAFRGADRRDAARARRLDSRGQGALHRHEHVSGLEDRRRAVGRRRNSACTGSSASKWPTLARPHGRARGHPALLARSASPSLPWAPLCGGLSDRQIQAQRSERAGTLARRQGQFRPAATPEAFDVIEGSSRWQPRRVARPSQLALAWDELPARHHRADHRSTHARAAHRQSRRDERARSRPRIARHSTRSRRRSRHDALLRRRNGRRLQAELRALVKIACQAPGQVDRAVRPRSQCVIA